MYDNHIIETVIRAYKGLCVHVREREGGKEREGGRERGREGGREGKREGDRQNFCILMMKKTIFFFSESCGQTSEGRVRLARRNSSEVIHSHTYSSLMKKVTVQMCVKHKDIIHDIQKQQNAKMYQSYPPFPRAKDGLQFQLRFYPTNFKHKASALYIDVVSMAENDGMNIPALKITVSICDSKLLSQADDVLTNKEHCIAYEERGVKGGLLSNERSMCIALFPQVIDHDKLLDVAGDAVVIQVNMEYSPLQSM